MSNSRQPKKLAKNTLYLYIRMLLLMVITFFTARVVIDKLGFVDYGIQNVVGGMASMFVFFRSALTNATQRYLSVALGLKDNLYAKLILRQHFTIYLLIGIVVIVIAEVFGLWLIYNKLNIPLDRLYASFWVFQYTIGSLLITILSVVLNAEIVAHENFKVYSYIGIVEGISKLLIAYAISIAPFDRLVVYNFLLFISQVGIFLFYVLYCKSRYEEFDLYLMWDKKSIREMFAFINWNIIGTLTYYINDWGISLLLNLFFGPVVNAARGIAFHVSQAIGSFSQNIYSSVRPQLIKSYAEKDLSYMNKLFYASSKYSVLLIWVVSLPLLLRMDDVLNLWLVDVPDYTSVFTIWVLAYAIVNALNEPIWTVALAVGKLKKYCLIGNGILLITIPFSYVALMMDCSPVSVFIIALLMKIAYVGVTLKILSQYVEISFYEYSSEVLMPSALVIILSGVLCFILNTFIGHSFWGLVLTGLVTTFINCLVLYQFGLKNSEKSLFCNYAVGLKRKLWRRNCLSSEE